MLNYPPLPTISLGPFRFYTWGLFVAIGVLAATILATRRARARGIPTDVVWGLSFWVTALGLLGARLLYVAEYWEEFRADPWQALAIWQGGMSAFGAVLFGMPTAWLITRRQGIPARSLFEAISPPLLLGDAIGRLGGALSHMYPGTPTSFPLSYRLDGVQRHEVGIELALASVLGFLVIQALERSCRRREHGRRQQAGRGSGSGVRTYASTAFCPLPTAELVLLWYSVERFLLDFLRAADLPGSDLRYAGLPPVAVAEGGLTLAQWFALAGIVLSLGMLWKRFRTRSPRAQHA